MLLLCACYGVNAHCTQVREEQQQAAASGLGSGAGGKLQSMIEVILGNLQVRGRAGPAAGAGGIPCACACAPACAPRVRVFSLMNSQ